MSKKTPVKTCSLSNCNNSVRARGWCAKHYTRWRNNGSPYVSQLDRETKVCTAEGCSEPVEARKLCKRHYAVMMTRRPHYARWIGMMARCYNKSSRSYEHYGARGITVCDRWKTYDNFREDLEKLGPQPTPKHTLDRIDNNKGYEPGNVRWSSPLEQVHNRRKFKVNTSGYVGVSWNKRVGKWAAQKRFNGRQNHLGYFDNPEDAQIAYREVNRVQ